MAPAQPAGCAKDQTSHPPNPGAPRRALPKQGRSFSADPRFTFHASRFTDTESDARTQLTDFFSILLEHEEEVKVIDVRAGGTGDDELMEPLQCGIGVVALQRAREIHGEALCVRHGITIDNSASRVSRTVSAIGADRHYPHLGQTGDFQSSGCGEFLRPPACSISGDGHGGFPTSHHTTGPLQRLAFAHNIPRQGAKSLPLVSGRSG